MLLEELINPEIKSREVNHFHQTKKRKTKKSKFYKIGSGSFGTVYKNKDPHLVTKVNEKPSSNIEEEDVYWFYIRKIIETKINDSNPYFPRIYGVTSYKQKDDQSEIRNARIEKLEPLLNFKKNKDLMIPVLLKLRKKEYLMNYLEIDEDFSGYNGENLIRFIVQFVYEDIKKSGVNIRTNDKQYLQAISFLRSIIDSNMVVDIHEWNLMFRRTPYGLQLVITDPIA